MEIKELYPNIIVYNGLFKDSEAVITHYKDSKKWDKWFVFGEMTMMTEKDYTFSTFPTPTEWAEQAMGSSGDEAAPYYDVLNAFFKATSHYKVNYCNEDFSNWKFAAPAICMYKTGGGATSDVGMYFHTDYQQERADAPGNKPVLTCTMYLNDDYEGGEICFKVLKDTGLEYDYIKYKPQAGDVLVFPSKPPYYHGVNVTTKGQKYFVRSFWQYIYSGTDEWLANEEKYGVELWAEMEKERERVERNTGRYNLAGLDED